MTESTIVCSKHFSQDNDITFSSKKMALKDDAVPTIFRRLKQSEERLLKDDTRQVKQKLPLQFGDINDKNIQVESPITCIHTSFQLR